MSPRFHAWAVVRKYGVLMSFFRTRPEAEREQYESGGEVIHFVEHGRENEIAGEVAFALRALRDPKNQHSHREAAIAALVRIESILPKQSKRRGGK